MRKHEKTERHHPESEHWQETQYATADQQRPGCDATGPRAGKRQFETAEHKFSTLAIDTVIPFASHSKPFGFIEKRTGRRPARNG